jgi:carboxymethylenebutenolidase
MDAPGKREELHDMARRLATAGYFVVLPNLYYRDTREFSIFSGDPSHTREAMFELMSSLSDELVLGDTAALLAFADADPAADAGRVGCMGYCMSGPFSFAAACAYPDRIRAAASLYGVRLFGPGSPADRATDATAELYFACAEFDDWVPADTVDLLERHLQSIGANARVERYPGVHHGFAFPGRGEAYDKPAAERHWERLHALFARNLA